MLPSDPYPLTSMSKVFVHCSSESCSAMAEPGLW